MSEHVRHVCNLGALTSLTTCQWDSIDYYWFYLVLGESLEKVREAGTRIETCSQLIPQSTLNRELRAEDSMARDKQFLSIHARDCSSILRCKQRRLSLTIAKPDHSKSALLDSFGFFRDLALLPFPSLSAPGLFRVESLYEDTDFAQQVWCYVLGVAMWCLVCCRCRDHMNCMSLHKLHHQLHSVAVNVVPSCLRLASRSPEISLRVGLLIYSPICGSLWRREWSIQLWKSENFAEFSLKLKAFAERDKSSCEFSNVCCSAKSLLAMSSYH
jgi:hypothetical protein